jgi:hypothetical protein
LLSINEGGRVKRGGSRSSGLHGASGREGVVGQGGGSASIGRWADSKGSLLDGLGRKVKQASGAAGPTGSELKRNSFRNIN